MITQLTQEAIAEYASDAQTIDEPVGVDYSQGVKVGRTVPAKWWNWLFRAATKRIEQSKTDAQNMLTELQNAVTDAGIALDGNDNTQLSQAITANASTQIQEFIEAKKGLFTRWETSGASITLGYLRLDWVWDDECCVVIAYDSRHWSYTLYATKDFVTWTSLYVSRGQDISDVSVTLAKFAGKHFVLFTDTTPSSANPATGMRVYEFDGAQFTYCFQDSGVTQASLSNLIPVMFVTEQRLGVIYFIGRYDSTSNPFRLRVRTTSDGVNWTINTYDSLANYRNRLTAAHAMRPVRGYEFSDGIVVGNAVIGSSAVTALSQVNLTQWFPRAVDSINSAVVLKLNNTTLVIKGDNNKIYTATTTGSSPTVTEHTIADITSYTLYDIVHNGSIILIQDNNNHYRFSSDGYTFTDTGVTDRIFEVNGVYFSGGKKSTDLVNWTNITIPAPYTELSVDNVVEQAGAVVAKARSASVIGATLVSLDAGETWLESGQPIEGVVAPPTVYRPVGLPNIGATLYTLTFTPTEYDTIMQAYATSNSINAVIGHTLYLH